QRSAIRREVNGADVKVGVAEQSVQRTFYPFDNRCRIITRVAVFVSNCWELRVFMTDLFQRLIEQEVLFVGLADVEDCRDNSRHRLIIPSTPSSFPAHRSAAFVHPGHGMRVEDQGLLPLLTWIPPVTDEHQYDTRSVKFPVP